MERIEILDGGILLFHPNLYQVDEANTILVKLQNEVEWSQERAMGHPVPRLNAWYGAPGLTYHYSGITHQGKGWLDWLLPIKEKVELASEAEFNSILLNRYRDGNDGIGFHPDNEPELGRNPVVATLSFGDERNFVMKHQKKKKERLNYALTNGSLLVMAGTTQEHWVHGIPKTEKTVGERISLTFRNILR